jgi:hypothetical protein
MRVAVKVLEGLEKLAVQAAACGSGIQVVSLLQSTMTVHNRGRMTCVDAYWDGVMRLWQGRTKGGIKRTNHLTILKTSTNEPIKGRMVAAACQRGCVTEKLAAAKLAATAKLAAAVEFQSNVSQPPTLSSNAET